MLSSALATIYLSDQRGCTQSSSHRSFHTFNFGEYFRDDRKGFGKIQTFNDDTLAGGRSVSYMINEFSLTMLIPLVGKILYEIDGVSYGSVEAGQVNLVSAKPGSRLKISNPYENDLVNYLYIQLSTQDHPTAPSLQKFTIDHTLKNRLQQVGPGISIGQFEGRKEAVLPVTDPSRGTFIFVIEGAFEVENRLLQSRDGLAVRDTIAVEMEALSNGAVVMCLSV